MLIPLLPLLWHLLNHMPPPPHTHPLYRFILTDSETSKGIFTATPFKHSFLLDPRPYKMFREIPNLLPMALPMF